MFSTLELDLQFGLYRIGLDRFHCRIIQFNSIQFKNSSLICHDQFNLFLCSLVYDCSFFLTHDCKPHPSLPFPPLCDINNIPLLDCHYSWHLSP